jgi:glycosyltransferase involved in cell wall biosynthesis
VPQALLAGVCPVAYDVDGTGEACVEMVTGRLVPAGDVPALREAILWCRDHPAERARLAATGQARCAREFSVEAMIDGLERVYWSGGKHPARD